MNVSFDALGPESRIWIYQASRPLTDSECQLIMENTSRFLESWTAHGHNLQAAVTVLHQQFIVMGVNEAVNEASGCSIDKSVHHIRELEKMLNISLLDRSKVALKNGPEIQLIDFSEIKNMINSGVIRPESEIFNNSLVTKDELEQQWLQPASDSWMKRYFTEK